MINGSAEHKALSMDLMNEAVAELRRNAGHYISGTAILSLPILGLSGYLAWVWFQSDPSAVEWGQWAVVWITVFALTFNQFLYGCCRSAQRSLAGEKPVFGDFFRDPGLAFGAALLASLLTGLSLCLGMIACLLGGLVTSSLLFVALPAVCSRNMSGWAALKWSWRTLRRHFLAAFAICNVVHLAAISGIAVLGIGGFLTLPLYPIAQAVLYDRLKRTGGAEARLFSSDLEVESP